MDKLEGGYIIHKAPPMRVGIHKHTASIPGRPISDFDLEATNRLQATPWRVNRRVLEVARALEVAGADHPLVPSGKPLPIPARLPDAVWDTMDEAARQKHRAALAEVHAENASRAGRRVAWLEALDTATTMEAHERFWFAWTHDFRLRRYPVACGGLSPQGDDFSKALLMFADGKPLGVSGFYWLCVRLANAMGHDKAPLDDRVKWVLQRPADWHWVVLDPVEHIDAWAGADEPWGALATIFEVSDALSSGNLATCISHLPVPLDGSCNGLQHLSAMGLDPIGARATNLAALDARQDVYMEVMRAAQSRVETDAAKGHPPALAWMGHVTRDAVKRTVLATPYGITDGGIQRQLVEDKRVPKSSTVSQAVLAAYFRDVLVDALSGTVVAAKQIMGWLQTCADRLAAAGLPMDWTTPTGSRVRQAYHQVSMTRVQTLVGRLALLHEVDGSGLDARKQLLGSAPNVVHSFDAAHLAATVNALGRHYGIRDFAMVHDSFAVHAADTATLGAVLRSEFVRIYETNWLERLWADFKAQAPHVDLPPPPERGDFDLLSNVPNSAFFFA